MTSKRLRAFEETRAKPAFKSKVSEKRAAWSGKMTAEELEIVVYTSCFLADRELEEEGRSNNGASSSNGDGEEK